MPHLDGLRGVAAVVVVIAHMIAVVAPALHFGPTASTADAPAPGWQITFATSPLFVFTNGSFAVFVFFVLSGYVIALSADHSRASLPRAVVARILRLGLPCAASLLLIHAIVNGGWSWSSALAKVNPHWWMTSVFRNEAIAFSELLAEVGGRYMITGHSKLNAVLWTMQRELLGSLGIIAIMILAPGRTARMLSFVLLTALLVLLKAEAHHYACFAAGALLYLYRDHLWRCPAWCGAAAIVLGLFLGGKPVLPPPPGTIYSVLPAKFAGLWAWPTGATLVVFGTLVWPPMRSLLGGLVGRALGRISFGLYLVHFAVIQSLFAGVIVTWPGPWGQATAWLTTLVTVFALALLFTLAVDEPATRLSRSIKRTPPATVSAPVP